MFPVEHLVNTKRGGSTEEDQPPVSYRRLFSARNCNSFKSNIYYVKYEIKWKYYQEERKNRDVHYFPLARLNLLAHNRGAIINIRRKQVEVIYKFTFEEGSDDMIDLKLIQNATGMYLALSEIREQTRQWYKYGDREAIPVEEIRDTIWDITAEHVDLDKLGG